MKQKFAGYLLLEWMLALALSSIIFVCVMTIYVSSYHRYQLQQAMLRNQTVAMTAIQLLKREMQLAGYLGCAKLSPEFPIQSYGEYSLTVENQLTVTSTAMTVRHAEWPAAMVLKSMSNLSEMIVSDHVGLNEGNIAIISDCTRAEIFQVAHRSVHKGYQRITTTQPLHGYFSEGAEVSRLAINTYFLRDTKRKNRDGSAVIALSLRDVHNQVTDIVDEIDVMRVYRSAQGTSIQLHVTTKPIQRWWHVYAATS